MKQFTLNNYLGDKEYLLSFIDKFLPELQKDKIKNQQKILELCHVAKFLSFFESKYTIDKINEMPDFILNSSLKKIGLELQVLVDNKTIEREGFFRNLFIQAESLLKEDSDVDNFLANIHIKPNANVKINEKQDMIKKLVSIIKQYLKTGILIENEVIERIRTMPHSQISLCPNFGGWIQKYVSEDLLIKLIQKKERLIDNYINNTGLNQWLLIIIGSTGESSYELNNNFEINIDSRFEKIYLMEDFNSRLYEIK
jgi:hypothetical protein